MKRTIHKLLLLVAILMMAAMLMTGCDFLISLLPDSYAIEPTSGEETSEIYGEYGGGYP